jgi:transcriptional regulator with XRE-family HTH domain
MKNTSNSQAPSLLALITERQTELGITDEQLAVALDYDRPTVVNMIKQGMVKVPVQKITALAGALSLDPAYLLRLHLSECMPEVLAAVDALLIPSMLTANEMELVNSYRHLSKGHDVRPVVVDGNAIIALVVA